MKVSLLLLIILFSSQQVSAGANLKNCPPVTGTKMISTGETVELPWCSDSSESVVVVGYGDLEKTNALLKEQNLFAVPVNGKAMFYITALTYNRSTIGSYHEVIVAVMSSPQKNLAGGFLKFLEFFNLNPFGPPKTHGEAVVKIWVDTDLALAAGNEIWGFNKSLAQISLSKDEGFLLKDSSGDVILQSRWSESPHSLVPKGGDLDFFTIPVSGEWAHAKSQGDAFVGKFKNADSLIYGRSEWGKTLQSLSIQPSLKMYIPNFSGQLFSAQSVPLLNNEGN